MTLKVLRFAKVVGPGTQTTFLRDVLTNAANKRGPYASIDDATAMAARQILNEYRSNPSSVSGTVIGVDLETGTMYVSRWGR